MGRASARKTITMGAIHYGIRNGKMRFFTMRINWFIYNRRYIKNTGQNDGTPGLDLNVTHVWEMGITGKGVTVAILDDGVDYLHPDLAPNYDPKSSWDFSGNDPYPFPRWTSNGFNRFGVLNILSDSNYFFWQSRNAMCWRNLGRCWQWNMWRWHCL